MFSLFRAVCIFLVSLSFPPRSFPLLTLPKYAATPNALIRYLTRRDICNYRQSLNYGPSAFNLKFDLLLSITQLSDILESIVMMPYFTIAHIRIHSKQLNIDHILLRASDLLKI